MRITSALYSPRAHTITLGLGRTPKGRGTLEMIVGASEIVNLLGQTLDGNGDGKAGVDYVGFLPSS